MTDPSRHRHGLIDAADGAAVAALLDGLGAPHHAGAVLMASPVEFDVRYAINPHMRDREGALQRVDRERARGQWDALRRTYEALGYPVAVLPAVRGLPDLVFAANQVLPLPDAAGRLGGVLPSVMRHAERAGEVPVFLEWFRQRGVPVLPAAGEHPFESHGDVLWHPRGRLLLFGHGPRSDRAVAAAVARAAAAPVVLLRLVDPDFYHLDTALVPLDGERALWVPAAFDAEGRGLLGALFPRLLEVPEEEARRAFAANAHCPDGRHVILDGAAVRTRELLEGEGFRTLPVDTSEFRKAGGSVFCLKLMLPPFGPPAGSRGA